MGWMGQLSSLLRSSAVAPVTEEVKEEQGEEEGELVLGQDDREMVSNLTERLVRSIRVEQSVLSLLGTILQIYKTAGLLGQTPEKVDLARVFRYEVVALLMEYWSEHKEVMCLLEEHCVIKPPQQKDSGNEEEGCGCCLQ